MDYKEYITARNTAWECLLKYNIDSLPVKVSKIIKESDNIRLFKDSDACILKSNEIGRTIMHNNIYEIVYRDTEPPYRCRFTIAHEIGHIMLNHLYTNIAAYRTFYNNDGKESAANVFARSLLAPACILYELNITEAEDISRVCNISMQAARIRSQRMQLLKNRNAWYIHPLERQVYTQFETFIKEYRLKQRR